MLQERIVPIVKGYELRETIGEGGYGVVYRAYQPLVGRDVAVKIILPQYANQPDFIRRFESEAQLVARLEHPYIVPLYDYWREPDGAFLVMRYLRGGSLHDLLHKGLLSLRLLDRLLDQIGGALAVAHRRGVVHRDLKPANILLDEDGNAYLGDFGIAKDIGTKVSPFQTDQRAVVGSPAYIAPEQVKAEAISPQTDIYSLGVMLYEMLTGTLPFQATTPIALMFKHVNEPVPLVRTTRPDLPDAVNVVIQRAMAKHPSDRYPDATTMIYELRQALAQVLSVTERLPDPSQAARAALAPPATPGRATSGSQTRSKYETGVLYLPTQPVVAEEQIENPYKGLRAFQEADAADFFGREALTQLLLARMQEPSEHARFLAVVGPSGSGKSSLVRAGLIPALKRGALPGSEQWFTLDMFPGAHPLEEVARALLRIAVDPPNDLVEPLSLDAQGLLRVVEQVVPGGEATEVVLVIDQFEELFTMVEDEATRTHVLDMIVAAVTDPLSRIRVLITLRADFYDRPLLYPRFSQLMRARTEVVVPLTHQELRAAILSPAERHGLHVDHELVELILADVGEQPGALPLLQYALTEVCERRSGRTLTLTPYQASGGVLGALSRRAEEIYSGLTPAQQEAARQLFLRLVTLGEGVEDTRRRVRRTELVPVEGDITALDTVITVYGQYRLLTSDHDPQTRAPTVEVAHEALIRTWGRLRAWLDASREDVRLARRLGAAAAEWAGSAGEPSFLARGQRLDHFAAWAQETRLTLNAEERAYLDASLADRNARRAAEAARAAREAALERRSKTFLRALVGVFALAAALALGLSVYAFQQQQVAQHNEERAVAAEAQAEAEATQARRAGAEAQNLALINGAQAALSRGNADYALALAMRANQQEYALPQAQAILAAAAYSPGTRRVFRSHTRTVNSVAFSPDGKTAVSASSDRSLILWDMATGKPLRTFKEGHTAIVNSVAFSPDGAQLLSGAEDNTLILWDVATARPLRTFKGHADKIQQVAFSPDGRTAISGSDDTTLILWDVATAAPLRTFKGHTQTVEAVAFSPDGKRVLSGSQDLTAILWDVATARPIYTFTDHTGAIYGVTFSPDSRYALTGSGDKTLILWDTNTGKPLRIFTGHISNVHAVAYSPNGRTILSGSRDGTMRLWQVDTAQPIGEPFSGHGDAINSVAFSPDGRMGLSGSRDFTLRLWNLDSGAVMQCLNNCTGGAERAIFSPDGTSILAGAGVGRKNLVTGVNVGTATLYQLATGAPLRALNGHIEAVHAVAFSPDGATAVDASGDGYLIVYNLATGEVIRRLDGHTDEVFAVAFSPDGRQVISGADDKTLILWDIASGKRVHTFEGHTNGVRNVVFGPDGRTVLSGSRDSTLILWDTTTGKPIRTFEGHQGAVRSLAISPDGTRAASGSDDKTLILWDVATARPIHVLAEHTGGIGGVAFSPDGKTVLSGSDDQTLILWDVATGQPIRTYVEGNGKVRDVAFSPDGTQFLSIDRAIRLWRIESRDQMIAWARANRYIPPLTCNQEQVYRLPLEHCST